MEELDAKSTVFQNLFREDILLELLEPHGNQKILAERKAGIRQTPITSICCPQEKFETVKYSQITDSLDGVFGFAEPGLGEVDYQGMSRKPLEHVGKQSERSIIRDTFDDGAVDKDKAMEALSGILQAKAYCRFRNVREAFRLVDLDKSGRVDRSEMRDFFAQFNLSEASADLFFDSMDPNENDELDYGIFMQRFGMIIQPGTTSASDDTSSTKKRSLHKESPNHQGNCQRNLVYGPGWLRKLG